MKNKHFSEMYTNATKTSIIGLNHRFLDETGCILSEKMMPDVSITVPDLEIGKKHIGLQIVYEETSGPCAHTASNSLLCYKKLSGASSYMECS
jgi:hypothetical protein